MAARPDALPAGAAGRLDPLRDGPLHAVLLGLLARAAVPSETPVAEQGHDRRGLRAERPCRAGRWITFPRRGNGPTATAAGCSGCWRNGGLFSLFVIGAAFVASCLADGGRVGKLILEKCFNLASLQWYEVHRIPWTTLGEDAAKLTVLALVAPVLVLLWSSRSRAAHGGRLAARRPRLCRPLHHRTDARSLGKRGPAGPTRDGHFSAGGTRPRAHLQGPSDRCRTLHVWRNG